VVSLLKIDSQDGTVITGKADFGKASFDPLSFADVADKLRGCAGYAQRSTAKSEKILWYFRQLESASDVADLAPLLSDHKPDTPAAQ
jgi:hypothetical protein